MLVSPTLLSLPPSGLCSVDIAPGGDSGQSGPLCLGAGPSLPPPPCPGEGGVAAASCWARAEPEHEHRDH